jgi:hypothetical protein
MQHPSTSAANLRSHGLSEYDFDELDDKPEPERCLNIRAANGAMKGEHGSLKVWRLNVVSNRLSPITLDF